MYTDTNKLNSKNKRKPGRVPHVNQTIKTSRRREQDEDLGVVADELDAMAGVDGGGAEPALLQPHGAALPASPKRIWSKHSTWSDLDLVSAASEDEGGGGEANPS